MQIFTDQLGGSLNERLFAVYVTVGSEIVLEDGARDDILAAAKNDGIEEHEVLRLDDRSSRGGGKGISWVQIIDEVSESSLFGSRKVLEVRLKSTAFNENALATIVEYAQNPSDNLLLIRLKDSDYRDKRKKWYGQLRSAREVVMVVVDELNSRDFVQWLQKKATALDLQLSRQAAEKLADYCEGNLIAARQELDKFKLVLEPNATIDVADIDLADLSNTDLFALMDEVYAGNAAMIAKRLDSLQNQGGSSRGLELGVLRQLTQTLTLAHAKLLDPGTNVPGYQRRRVDSLANRHGLFGVEALLIECAQYNSMLLGMARGDEAGILRDLLYAIAGKGYSRLDHEYPWRMIDRLAN